MVMALTASTASAAAPVASMPSTIAVAIASPERTASDKAADDRRKPVELLAFSQVKYGDKVVDLIPGSGYFTRLFSLIVGPAGRVYAVWPNEYAHEAIDDVAATRAMTKQFSNVSVLQQPAAAFMTPEKIDVVWTSQNYHDYPDKFMGNIDPLVFDR